MEYYNKSFLEYLTKKSYKKNKLKRNYLKNFMSKNSQIISNFIN